MRLTQMRAEKAANRASREVLKSVRKVKSKVDFDELHLLRSDTIEYERHTTQVIQQHIRDCYIASWITEADLLEDMFGDRLLIGFLQRLAAMREEAKTSSFVVEGTRGRVYAPDRRLIRDAERYADRIFISRYTRKAFREFRKNIEKIKFAPRSDYKMLVTWRTGEHGESGLGYRLTTILRTESDTAQVAASAAAYGAAGINYYKFNAMLDDKTCDICRGLHGQIFPLKAARAGVNFPTIHPRCRCYVEPILRL